MKKMGILSCIVLLSACLLVTDAFSQQTVVYFRNLEEIDANVDRQHDDILIDWLVSEFGVEVTEFNPAVETPDSIDEFDLAYVSETTTSGDTADEGYHLNSPTPMVTGEQALQDDYAFQPGVGNANPTGSSIEIINNTHPITQGLPMGEVQIYSEEFEISQLEEIPDGVTVLATEPGNPDAARLWLVEEGATVNGTTSPGIRMSIGLQAQEAFGTLTDEGMQIYRQAFAYLLGQQAPSHVDNAEDLK